MLVLDTNVLAEVMRPSPSAAVLAWLDEQDPDHTWVCAIGCAEIAKAMSRLRVDIPALVGWADAGSPTGIPDHATRSALKTTSIQDIGLPISHSPSAALGFLRQPNLQADIEIPDHRKQTTINRPIPGPVNGGGRGAGDIAVFIDAGSDVDHYPPYAPPRDVAAGQSGDLDGFVDR